MATPGVTASLTTTASNRDAGRPRMGPPRRQPALLVQLRRSPREDLVHRSLRRPHRLGDALLPRPHRVERLRGRVPPIVGVGREDVVRPVLLVVLEDRL